MTAVATDAFRCLDPRKRSRDHVVDLIARDGARMLEQLVGHQAESHVQLLRVTHDGVQHQADRHENEPTELHPHREDGGGNVRDVARFNELEHDETSGSRPSTMRSSPIPPKNVKGL